MSALARSDVESHRFGLQIARCTDPAVDLALLAEQIVEQRLDLVILRLPATDLTRPSALARLGLPVIHADTLVYFETDLSLLAASTAIDPALQISAAEAADTEALGGLAALCFSGYRSHYAANPLLDPQLVEAGYADWAVRLAQEPGQVWLARREGAIIGFICCRDQPDKNSAEIVLNGVDPQHAGRGMYGALVRHVLQHHRRLGRRRLLVSTQIGNRAPQKVWAREGFVLSSAMQTFHINALLGSGDCAVDQPLELGDDRSAAAVLRQVERLLPGSLRQVSTLLLRPLEPPLRLRIRWPRRAIASTGRHAVATVEHPSGVCCAVLHCHLADD